MTRTAVAIRHVAFEDVGVWAETLAAHDYALSYVEAGVDDPSDEALLDSDLLIVLGGPIGVYETEAFPFLVPEIAAVRRRLDAQKPILGVCLGAQLMATALGARVAPGPAKEIGYAPVELTDSGRATPLARLAGLPVLHWHGDVCEAPANADRLAWTDVCAVQAFRAGPAALALQFHVEVDPRRIETWLIGHAVELGKAGLDSGAIRGDAGTLGAATAAAGRALLSDWLQTIGQ
jgi:GMP synthase (glutamine-hydrolysing)